MRTLALALAVMTAPPLAVSAVAQTMLDQARRHYDAAAYEEALSTLARADRGSPAQLIEVEEYRALCLFALGRTADAEKAIATIVETDPMYVPDASPRVESFISGVRSLVLPGVARRLLDRGRAAYTRKEFERAEEDFSLLLRILADPVMQGRAETVDLRVLADGFTTLLAAASAPAPSPEPSEPAAPPAAKPVAPVVVPAAVIREVLPPWMPDRVSALQEYAGAIKLTIGTDGRVKSATIEDVSHPAYDARILQAVTTWRYTPATRDGAPIESDRMIAVRLRPAQ